MLSLRGFLHSSSACRVDEIAQQHPPTIDHPFMIPEIIRYQVPHDHSSAFEGAYREAEALLQLSPNCEGYELIQSDKEPENYILTIWWDSSEGHLEGFRKSELFPKFLQLIRPYIPMISEMEHYHFSGISWRRSR
jgi:heme-degrading monooxygenase HmoA